RRSSPVQRSADVSAFGLWTTVRRRGGDGMLFGMTTISRCATLCVVVPFVVGGCANGTSDRIESAPPSTVTAATDGRGPRASPPPPGRWAAILHRLDRRRDRAFTRGAPSLLGRVYTPGSEVRRADARVIRAYRRRGLEVSAVRLRLDTVDVMRRAAQQATLRVVDTLEPVRVRTDGGAWRALPGDRPTERLITLHRLDAGWRIAGVRRVAG
ncbi:MAG: hypothetical protein ACRDO7_03565, partial [Nocardioidaceae bacterium]